MVPSNSRGDVTRDSPGVRPTARNSDDYLRRGSICPTLRSTEPSGPRRGFSPNVRANDPAQDRRAGLGICFCFSKSNTTESRILEREDTLGQPRGTKVFELELRTDETGKATAAVPCNYLEVFVAHEGFAPAAQKILITADAHTFSVPLKTYPITRTTEVLVSGSVSTVTAELPAQISPVAVGPSAESARTVFFCTLSGQQDRYKDALVTLRVRVKSLRHGASIGDPSCPKRMLVLIPRQSAVGDSSVTHFYQFLQEHRLSKKPILATIAGRLVADSDSGFVKPGVVFELESVSEVSEGDQPTHP